MTPIKQKRLDHVIYLILQHLYNFNFKMTCLRGVNELYALFYAVDVDDDGWMDERDGMWEFCYPCVHVFF